MRKETKSKLIWAVAIIAVVCVIGTLTAGFSSWDIKKNLDKERNPANLIDLEAIQLLDGKDATSDVKIDVDDDGVVKLTGKATSDDEFIYATVHLAVGTYKLTGASNGTHKTYCMGLKVGDELKSSDSDPISISTEGDYQIVIVVKEDCDFGTFGTKLYPVLCDVDDDASFWKK